MKKKKIVKSNKINKKLILKSDTLKSYEDYIKRKDKISSFFLSKNYTKMTEKELSSLFLVPKSDKSSFKKILNELENEGLISKDSKGRYIVLSKKDTILCTFEAKSEGFGFGIVAKKKENDEDIYIPKENVNGALNEDTVIVTIDKKIKYDSKHKKVGKVVKIQKRALKQIVGFAYLVNKKIIVSPINYLIPSLEIHKVLCKDKIENGSLVIVKINSCREGKNDFCYDIIKVISKENENLNYVKALEISYFLDIKENFPKNVLDEIEYIDDIVKKEDLLKREDKTDDNVYTIDSEDSKDLDDAICVKKNQDGTYLLSVHIADVSHYVKDGSFLDKEASKRATSIYIPSKVIPMLPKKLSNGICSLNEGEIRLTLSVDMHIDKTGKVIKSKIYKSYIKSKKKMTYEKVYKCILKSDKEVLKEYKDYIDDINLMVEIAKILKNKRDKEGSINFDIPETKVVLNEDGSINYIAPYEKNIANDIIEEFMLICNKTVAEKFLLLNAPFIYRVHEKPDVSKLRDLNEILSMYNKRLKSVSNITPKDISNVLSLFSSEEEKVLVSNVVLRSLKLAKYDNRCLGHFGLAFKYYCHFTSPIRRYPDLFIHRVISDYLDNSFSISNKKYKKYENQAVSYSLISSEMEKQATKIERDFDSIYMAMYMEDKIGNEYEGVISSVTQFGFFVMIPSNTAEGLVHVSSLKGYYVFDEKRYMLINKGANKVYKIGDKVKVKVSKVSVKLRQIDFIVI